MIYPGARQKARPRDVITLALRAGERAGLYGLRYGVTPEYFEPDEWKGGPVPKEVNHQRTWTKLDAREQDVLRQAAASVAKGRHHDMLDAVGIGLFGIGR